jgi:hypothetical protein
VQPGARHRLQPRRRRAGDPAFDFLWIVLGLVGFAATFVTGLFMIKPASERIGAAMAREGVA